MYKNKSGKTRLQIVAYKNLCSKSDLCKRKINHVIDAYSALCSIFPIRESADLERICGETASRRVKYLRKDGEKERRVYLGYVCIPVHVRHDLFYLDFFFHLSLYLSSKSSHVSRFLVARRNRVEKRRSSGGQIFSRENLSHRKQPSSTTQKCFPETLEYGVDVVWKNYTTRS